MAGLFCSREVLAEICWVEISQEIFFFFHIWFWCLTRHTNASFKSNKPTHYLLDYGDFKSIKPQYNLKFVVILNLEIGKGRLVWYRILHEFSQKFVPSMENYLGSQKEDCTKCLAYYTNKIYHISRFLAKTLRINKIAMKCFRKHLWFGVDIKLWQKWYEKLDRNPDWRVVMLNCVCDYGVKAVKLYKKLSLNMIKYIF